MKVAIQIFGHLRTFERCAQSLNANLLDQYPDHDVFLHTWDRLESETVAHHAPLCDPAPVDDRVLAAIEFSYHPRRMSVESQTPRDMGDLTFTNGWTPRPAINNKGEIAFPAWVRNADKKELGTAIFFRGGGRYSLDRLIGKEI